MYNVGKVNITAEQLHSFTWLVIICKHIHVKNIMIVDISCYKMIAVFH